MSEQGQLEALLVERGLITGEQLATAMAEQERTERSLTRVLIELGLVQEADLVATIAAQLGMDFVDLAEYPVDPTAVSIISDALARRYHALPIAWDDGVLVVAMADPANVIAIDDIRSMARAPVRSVVATRAAIEAAINKHHRLDNDVEGVTSLALDDSMDDDDDLAKVTAVSEDAPIVKLANLLIRQAIQDRASDIHIEPTSAR